MMRIKIMIIMMIIILSLLSTVMVSSYSIKITKKNFYNSLRMAAPSYKDSLQNARNLKQNPNVNIANNNKPIVEVRKPLVQNVVEEQEDDDSLPFTDEMYDHLKYVIGKLTSRMKSEKSLTENELKRFKESIEAIIKDSKQDGSSYNDNSNDYNNLDGDDMNQYTEDENEYGNENNSSFEATSIDISKLPEDLRNNPFVGEFKGSTWQIAGMDDMTKEEYYDALNKKLADLKQKKVDMFGRDPLNNPALSYEESLSKKKRG